MDYTPIYHFLTTIPKGKVVSYQTIAQKFHIHPRTVWIVMRKNTQPDKFPCYKVLASDGSLGGFALWLDEKIRRLEKDGIEIINEKVDKKYFRN